ncbi:uncharacterized protein PAC_18220 [Phialocephala subalpina]|uniref:Zn(2)-C6 fungal-type domain-containing protein n=1 Tax=Phialocephala subalpina TaxID=576137 RepID=A0A1L7XTF6_9HELO|nr:uncharacterized protein PAC_18220 [Phialocephala subalpina]
MWTPEKRQRVTRACDLCKRKKKQCSGTQPCATCHSKSASCIFSAQRRPQHQQHQNQHKHSHSRASFPSHEHSDNSASNSPDGPLRHKAPSNNRTASGGLDSARAHVPPSPKEAASEDATPIQNRGRLLQDGEGRLVYVGDSATLSFLQTIRRLVEKRLGPSPFTTDTNRHKILEATVASRDATAGLCDIFDRQSFESKVSETFEHPLDADPQWLCQVNLVFAVGFQMRNDRSIGNDNASKILDRLECPGVKRAERFYLAARQLSDPAVDFEAGGIGVLQSLLLIMLYMLASSKRSSAWGYLGMAVNLSYALGIHKEETLPIFDSLQQARSLGRPNHVSCETASELCSTPSQSSSRPTSSAGNDLSFAVNASKIVGKILSRVYYKRKASRSIAYQLSLCFSDWSQKLPPDLHWRVSSFQSRDPTLTLKRLHINLICFHGIIILTRPFFLHQISRQVAELEGDSIAQKNDHMANSSRMEKEHPEQTFRFDSACVRAALHSVTAVNNAFTTDALPRRNPFVIYWLFSAALIILANLFSPVYREADSEPTVRMALKIMRFCGEADPQARRYQTILESFLEALQEAERSKEQATNKASQTSDIFSMIFGNERSNTTGGESPAQTHNRMPAVSTAPVAWADDQFPTPNIIGGLETLCFATGINGRVGEPSSSMDVLDGQCDNSMDSGDIWWSGGQDFFFTAGDVQVPLYGLMEPT